MGPYIHRRCLLRECWQPYIVPQGGRVIGHSRAATDYDFLSLFMWLQHVRKYGSAFLNSDGGVLMAGILDDGKFC